MAAKKKFKKSFVKQVKQARAEVKAGKSISGEDMRATHTFPTTWGSGGVFYQTSSSVYPPGVITATSHIVPKRDPDALDLRRELDKKMVHVLIMGAIDTPQAVEKIVAWHYEAMDLCHQVFRDLLKRAPGS